MYKLLVTGGAGFIGGNFIHYVFREHSDVKIVCLDALTYAGNLETLKDAFRNNNFRFVHGDITDRDMVSELFREERFDAVINFAAESHVDRSITSPEIFLKTNILGTQVLLDACNEFEVPRFHQVSTDEVYGDLPIDRPDLMFTEESPIRASSPYSASKASADLLVLAYYRTYKTPVTLSRCSNNYGPYQFPEKLIPLMYSNALAHKPLPVYGQGLNVRDWLYVDDHCSALWAILTKGVPGEVYNIGGHNERANIEVVKTILAHTGRSEELIQFVADRPGHDRRYAIDPSKMMRDFGWKPLTPFEEGIGLTLKWYGENGPWLEHILSGKYLQFAPSSFV